MRAPGLLFEPFEGKPYDLFFFALDGRRFVGRKRPFPLAGGRAVKCALVSAAMLEGEVMCEQVGGEGVAVYHRPLSDDGKRACFSRLQQRPDTELLYPYPRLTRERREPVRREWAPTPEEAAELDSGEEVLRRTAVELLGTSPLDGAVLYDPACSTGSFLSSLQARFPAVSTVGQDRSPRMVELSRGRLDRVYLGDAARSPLADGTADYVFCRFLNLDVVTTRDAHRLFVAVAKRCRDGGLLVVFGHTPVLVASPFFEALGLEVLQRTACSRELDAVFQFYVLRKTGALRELPPEWEGAWKAAHASGSSSCNGASK